MSKLQFEITTPERVVLTREAESITLPTAEGEITVLPGHVPLVGVLRSGMVTVRQNGSEEYLAVSDGFLEIQPGGKVIALADSADRAEELDLARVEEARARAVEALTGAKNVDVVSSAAASAALERELSRLKVARRHHARRRDNLPQQP
jgi:F-type H+-transporting ATPase subunit epsilon